ncbi:MAG: flagellin FliC [Gammaproteobacteria bacterium]|nr:flagellin FliC [Gammaproteobacteria bacterium]
MININSESNTLGVQQMLNGSQGRLESANEKLASGLKINRASDDAANLAVAIKYANELAGGNKGLQNSNDAISMLQVADGGLAAMSDITLRMQELATQSGNGALSKDDRATLQGEMQQLQSEMVRIAKTTKFNGISLLADDSQRQFQLGAEAGNGVALGGIDAASSLGGLGIGSIDLSSTTSSPAALDIIGAAQGYINQNLAAISANMSRIESAATSLKVKKENVAAARSRIMDTDYAQEVANRTSALIQNQSGQAMLAQANVSAQPALAMLNS